MLSRCPGEAEGMRRSPAAISKIKFPSPPPPPHPGKFYVRSAFPDFSARGTLYSRWFFPFNYWTNKFPAPDSCPFRLTFYGYYSPGLSAKMLRSGRREREGEGEKRETENCQDAANERKGKKDVLNNAWQEIRDRKGEKGSGGFVWNGAQTQSV